MFDLPAAKLISRRQLASILEAHLKLENCLLVKIQIQNMPQIISQHGHKIAKQVSDSVQEILLEKALPGTVSKVSPALFAMLSGDWIHPNTFLGELQDALDTLNRDRNFPFIANIWVGATVARHRSGRPGLAWFVEADLALEQAGRKGRPQVFEAIDSEWQAIRNAFARLSDKSQPPEGMHWVYQPINDAKTGKVFAFEALCRWDLPGIGPIAPSVFVPLAEEFGIVPLIDRWGLESLEGVHEDLFAHGGRCISFNVSAVTLAADDSFASLVKELVKRNNACGCELIIELTETALSEDRGRIKRQLEQMRSHGVKIAIDDFGTGSTSLGNVAELPCDFLKVDGSILRSGPAELAIGLLGVAKKMGEVLGAKLIVEGVETLRDLELVRQVEAEYCQGWYFGQPIDIREDA